MGRRNRPARSRPGRNRTRRSLAEQKVRAERDEDRPSLAARPRRSSPPPVRCVTGKAGFSEAEARRKLEQYASEPSSRRDRPVRVYPCPKCGSWHLTSRQER